MTRNDGFTLVEMMIVVALLTMFATMALPLYPQRIAQTQVEEALLVAAPIQSAINRFYAETQKLPADLAALGLPTAAMWRGNFVTRIAVADGAIHVHLGQKAHALLHDRVVSLRPAVVADAPVVPIAWVCGLATVPDGMAAAAANHTTAPPLGLPLRCRL